MDKNEICFEGQKETIRKQLQNIGKNPFYKKMFEENAIDINRISTYEEFCKIPIMSKDDYKEAMDLLNREIKDKKVVTYYTSGSTGKPTKIMRTMQDEINQNTILCRYRNLFCSGIIREKWIFLYYTYTGKTKENNVFQLTANGVRYDYFYINEESMKAMYKYICSYSPKWLVGSVSAIYNLAKYIDENCDGKINFEEPDNRIAYIECTSEYLFNYQRKLIEKVFGVSPVSLYGSIELNAIAYECKCGSMHIVNENVYLEITDENENGYGEVVLSSLLNKETPLLRYRQGDYARWAPRCECGMPGHCIQLSGYRNNDYLIMSDGSKIEMWFMSDLLYELECVDGIVIKQFMVVQNTYRDIEIVLDIHEFSKERAQLVKTKIENAFERVCNQKMNLDFSFDGNFKSINESSGKFRYFKSLVNAPSTVC